MLQKPIKEELEARSILSLRVDIEKVLLAYKDPQKKMRLKDYECILCFYFRRGYLSGQAFTEYTCLDCGDECIYHTTSTPKLCTKCAQADDRCVRCAGSLFMKIKDLMKMKVVIAK